ncbi:MAG: hypothetical protein PHW94_08670, partial [Sulfurimonas sp.]|nr:hypothetical protein [Sulfurimonas sp.]
DGFQIFIIKPYFYNFRGFYPKRAKIALMNLYFLAYSHELKPSQNKSNESLFYALKCIITKFLTWIANAQR